MMKQANILLLLVVSMGSWSFNDHGSFLAEAGSYSIGFDRVGIDADTEIGPDATETTTPQCTAPQLKKLYKIYDYALIEGGLPDLPEESRFQFRANVTRELDTIEAGCLVDADDEDDLFELVRGLPKKYRKKIRQGIRDNWTTGLKLKYMDPQKRTQKIMNYINRKSLANGFPVADITCGVGSEGEAQPTRNLAAIEVHHPEEKVQGRRELQYYLCDEWCHGSLPPIYPDCFCTGERRRNLRVEGAGSRRALTATTTALDKQIVVDTIYDLCLKHNIDTCIDCAAAVVCDGDDATSCVRPYCHDLDQYPDGCWETGTRG